MTPATLDHLPGADRLRDRVVPFAEWRDAAASAARRGDPGAYTVRDGVALRDAILLDASALGVVKAVDVERRRATFVISTGARDRDRDSIDPRGWELAHFRRNPVVPFAHDYRSLPIAQAVAIGVEGQALVSTAEFYDGPDFPFAMTVLRMVAGRFLRAASVGFVPLEWSINEDAKGVDFRRQELLEWSVVPVPANPEALSRARDDLDLDADELAELVGDALVELTDDELLAEDIAEVYVAALEEAVDDALAEHAG